MCDLKVLVFLIIVPLMGYDGIAEAATQDGRNQENPIIRQAETVKIVTTFRPFYNLLALVRMKYREENEIITMGEFCYNITKDVDQLASLNVILMSVIMASADSDVIQYLVRYPMREKPQVFIDAKTINTMRRFNNLTDKTLDYDIPSIVVRAKAFIRAYEPTVHLVDWFPTQVVESLSWRKMQDAISCLAFVHRVESNADFFQLYMDGVKAIATERVKLQSPDSMDRIPLDLKLHLNRIIDQLQRKSIRNVRPKGAYEEMVNLSHDLEKRFEYSRTKMRSEHLKNAGRKIAVFGLTTLACMLGLV